MKLSSACMGCLVQRQMENISKYDDENKKSDYMRNVLATIAGAKEEMTAPEIISEIGELHLQYFGSPYSFEAIKEQYNLIMLKKEEDIWSKVISSEDSLLTALKFSRAGNYIDFGAMGSIDDNKLDELIQAAQSEYIDTAVYHSFVRDLENARELVLLTDNCGEIVLDKLLIQCIKKEFPGINVKVVVRGTPVLNDATIEDAEMVGFTEIAEILGNGTGIAGTCLNRICPEAKGAIEAADVIISKGQGNFETINGCGLNIYYLFLCKCDWFVKRFRLEQFKGAFLKESTY